MAKYKSAGALPGGTGLVKVVASVPALAVAGTDAVVPGVQTVGQILAATGTGGAPSVAFPAGGGFYEASSVVRAIVGGGDRLQISSSGVTVPSGNIGSIQGGLRLAAIGTKTANYTLAVGTDHTMLGDATGGAFDITLPSAAGNAGFQFTVKRINAGGNAVTVKSAGGTIDGVAAATGIALSVQYQSRTYESDGANWFITGGYL